MKGGLLYEVHQLKKIAGLLKEEDLDLSDNPLARRDVSVDDIINSNNFISVVNDETEIYLFGFGDFEGRCYMLDSDEEDLVDDTIDPYIYPLKRGLTVKKVIDMGKVEGFFHGEIPNIEYNAEYEAEMYAWLNSLRA